jgi:hypothetical protein
MITWELRFRTARGQVDNVQIETFTKDEAEARAVADRYLDSLGSPATRFIYVRPIVVASSADYPDLVMQYKGPAPKPPLPAKEAGKQPPPAERTASTAPLPPPPSVPAETAALPPADPEDADMTEMSGSARSATPVKPPARSRVGA